MEADSTKPFLTRPLQYATSSACPFQYVGFAHARPATLQLSLIGHHKELKKYTLTAEVPR
eukprot:6064173-Amphidinium_carterae.1